MRTIKDLLTSLGIVLMLSVGISTPASADSIDLGAGVCSQDGVEGYWNGTTTDDAGCVTAAEYSILYSPPNLLAAGVITGWTDNGDGTVSMTLAQSGVIVEAPYEPMDRSGVATKTLDDPEGLVTIRDIWEAGLRLRVK